MQKTSSRNLTPTIRTLERGLDILDFLRESQRPQQLSAIGDALSLSPSTIFRLLATLEQRGYVIRNDNKRYSLGLGAMEPGSASSLSILSTLTLPILQELQVQFGESISIYIPSGDKRVCIQRVECSHPLRQVIQVGDRLSLAVGAGGKVLVAWLSLIPGYEVHRLTPPLSPALLEDIRKAGYAASFDEREKGVYAVAAPIFNAAERIVAALTLSGPTVRLNVEQLPIMANALMEKAREVTSLMK